MAERKLSDEELDAMVREASVGTYTDKEFFYGIAVILEDSISFPFMAEALGATVEVVGIDAKRANQVGG